VPPAYLPVGEVHIEAETRDDELLQVMIRGVGVLDIDRGGAIHAVFRNEQISHDADRLGDGHLLYGFGWNDVPGDAQATEVDAAGQVVWSWHANAAYEGRFGGVADAGWTHANGVQRLADGRTLVSLRNFALTAIVDPDGAVVAELDWSRFGADVDPHDPVMLANGHVLVCLQNDAPYDAVEVDATTGAVVWGYADPDLRTVRDCDRLPNGNTLLVGVQRGADGSDASTLVEVTAAGQVVWQLTQEGVAVNQSPGVFYKAERAGTPTD
jgi:hypothetical protein